MTEAQKPSQETYLNVFENVGKGKVMSLALINAMRQVRTDREEAARVARQQAQQGGSDGTQSERELLLVVPEFHHDEVAKFHNQKTEE